MHFYDFFILSMLQFKYMNFDGAFVVSMGTYAINDYQLNEEIK